VPSDLTERCKAMVTVRVWSEITVTPGTLCTVYPCFEAVTAYVSGASEMKLKCPFVSVFVDAFCEGEVTVTAASATGPLLTASTVLPVMPPVVPDSDGAANAKRQAAATNATAIL
ncbi:MAG TPA: hypothetical protein VK216_05920, partial [Magnetospirillaceae bacterium]|nr:hypothetical protein [Magnetospirillaceae bacterium]